MRTASRLMATVALIGCGGLEPSNTDLGLRVEASVSPRGVRATDTTAVLHIRVTVTNPSDEDVIVVTGGPPYHITRDPKESIGLAHSFRIASPTDSLNGGPSVDWWGSSMDTIRAGRGLYAAHEVSLKDWRAGGWPLEPGAYRVRGYYNGREDWRVISVLPLSAAESTRLLMSLKVDGFAPLLQVFDMPASVAFYRKVLGFTVVKQSQPGDDFDWGLLRLNDSELMLNTAYEKDDRPPEPDPARVAAHLDTALFFDCRDVGAAYRYLRAKGIDVKEPVINDYGMKQLYLRDPDGYNVCFQCPA